jgi:NurA-like 5'-3' nuclease
MADEEKVKKLEKILNENAKKTEDKIKNLSEELEAERRKSMMDEQKAMNLERALNEKIYFLNELTRKKSDDQKEIQILK